MRLVSFVRKGRPSYRAVLVRSDPGATPAPDPTLPIVDLGARLLAYPDLRALLAADALDAARALSVRANVDCTLGDVSLQRPIPWPEKIVCVGVNYAERNEEYRDNADAPNYASLFVRMPDSLVAHGAPVLRPPESAQLDYEGEIVIVVGRGGRRIPAAQARDHVAGLTLMNEGTVRDWLRHGKFNVTQGKNFVASGAVGPWIVTTDECPDFTDITIRTRVNGEVRQDDNTRRMMFPFDRLIEYISTFMVLKPGDLIATGTPTGAGARFDPPKWLVPGDTIEIEATGIGVLRNGVADEVPRSP